ncbi:hypothetical protein ACH5RR_025516 [Cinchona calisaya]|uniref:Uncharacterized protein n=1 Tax=Cinchona calisaya TaxID=153742 RepID=A0ABD2Z293_9GENT
MKPFNGSLLAICCFLNDKVKCFSKILQSTVSKAFILASSDTSNVETSPKGDFEGNPVLESTLEAYGDFSCETSLDTESSKLEANFLDSELSSSLVPRVMTVHVLVRSSLMRSTILATIVVLLPIDGPIE